jgi:glyoxylase-like metal-dependent hydrolase (beta-lactamase superfamily II)
VQKIGENVYVANGIRGCKAGFVVTKEGVVMIDSPQYPADAMKWRDEVAKHGPLRYLIHTEPHVDHFLGDYFFEGSVVAHEGTREAVLAFSMDNFMEGLKKRDPLSHSLFPADFHLRPATITLSDRMTLYLGDHTFHLINHPGHTPYQVAVYIPEERVVFTSDNIFHKVMTFLQAALPYEWLDSLKRLEELDVDVLIPGHGTICDKSYIKEQAAIVQGWIDAIKTGINQGLSMEEMQDKPPYVDPYQLEYGVEYLAQQLPRMNVACLYKALKK